MKTQKGVRFAATGHQEILESIQEKRQLVLIRAFNSDNTVCALATTRTNNKVFIKVKGYLKARDNEERLKRAITSNRMAAKIQSDIIPRTLEFKAFERNDVLWLTMLSSYGGESMSRGLFFDGDDALVDQQIIARLRHAVDAIQKTPAVSVFHPPENISKWIVGAFGRQVVSAASEWTSAHCDFHWANILNGGRHVVDWDMFSIAPKGFDAASIVLFSSSNTRLFERLHREFIDYLNNDSARVATLFAGARILRLMRLERFADMRIYEPNIREAVKSIIGSRKR